MKTAIVNGKVITPAAVLDGKVLVLEGGVISEIADSIPAGAERIDAGGFYVAPGFIDMHTHGAGGADFMDGTIEAYLTAARMHAQHGTTMLFPTTLTSTNEALFDSLSTYGKALELCGKDGAAFGGMHLEGPYFAPEMAGAQDPRYLRDPKPEDYNAILDRTHHIARWSFAPERPGSAEFASELKKRGIVSSIGHTNATFADCDAAFKAGCSLMTHFYSCMSTITRRNAYRYAGVIEYGYWQDAMDIEIIADGNIIMAQGRVDAPAGQTVSGEYELRSHDLINAGIVSIHEMSMRMHIDGDDLGDSSGYTDTVSVVTDTESVSTERDMSLFQELYNEDGIVALVESTARKNEIGDFEYLILFENNTDDTLLLEPILHLASGNTRVGYNKIPPHAKITISNSAHEGDTCLVRVSLVQGEHDHEKLFETDEVAIEMP